MISQDLNVSDGRYAPDEEGGEEAATDPNVEDGGITKLGDVATDPVVEQKHIEDAEVGEGEYERREMCASKGPQKGEGSSSVDGYDGEVEGGVGAEDDQESGNEILHHLGRPLPETQTCK